MILKSGYQRARDKPKRFYSWRWCIGMAPHCRTRGLPVNYWWVTDAHSVLLPSVEYRLWSYRPPYSGTKPSSNFIYLCTTFVCLSTIRDGCKWDPLTCARQTAATLAILELPVASWRFSIVVAIAGHTKPIFSVGILYGQLGWRASPAQLYSPQCIHTRIYTVPLLFLYMKKGTSDFGQLLNFTVAWDFFIEKRLLTSRSEKSELSPLTGSNFWKVWLEYSKFQDSIRETYS